jgi:hypothetical protein
MTWDVDDRRNTFISHTAEIHQAVDVTLRNNVRSTLYVALSSHK